MEENGGKQMNLLEKYLKLKKSIIESSEHPMIEHNGKMVHRNNSEGQPIHHTDAGIKAFHDWSGGSELKDEHGRPKVMYHGTSSDKDYADFKVPKNGAWFTDSKEGASAYASSNDSQNTKYDHFTGKFHDINTASRVVPVYIKSKNTHNITPDENKKINVENYKRAQGQVFSDMKTKGVDMVNHGGGVVSVIGDSSQIKSAIGNRGTYSQKSKKMNESEDYKGEHGAPDPESGAPLHNLKGIYPDDFYDNPKHYSDGSHYDNESTSVMKYVKDKPNRLVKIYRAVPKVMSHQDKLDEIDKHKRHILKYGKVPSGVNTSLNSSKYYDKLDNDQKQLESNPPASEPAKIKINKGDWVTASHTYAKEHGRDNLKNNYKILSKTVKASELYIDGNSIHEYGYHPTEKTLKESMEIEYWNNEENI